MMVAALGGCGNAVPDKSVVSAKSISTMRIAPATNHPKYDAPVRVEIASSFEEPSQHSDPQMRLAALEVWAASPSESLDPVTYALVDPDEAVRVRAQELLEQELMRR